MHSQYFASFSGNLAIVASSNPSHLVGGCPVGKRLSCGQDTEQCVDMRFISMYKEDGRNFRPVSPSQIMFKLLSV